MIDRRPSVPGALGGEDLPSTGRLLLTALRSARQHPLATFLGLPITAGMAVAGCLVPWFNFPFVLLALAQCLGGLSSIAMVVARDGRLDLWAPLLGFKRYERYLGLFGGTYLMFAFAALPFFMSLWIDRHVLKGDHRIVLFGLAGGFTLAVLFAVFHRYLFAPFAAAYLPRYHPFPAILAEAQVLLFSSRQALLTRFALLSLFGLSGLVAGGVGVLVTTPVALVAMAHLYLEVRRRVRGRTSERPTDL